MIFFVVFLLIGLTHGKIYDRCELARELKFVHKAADHQLATWVCIAEHESQYNTSIVGHLNGDGSGDHGIFQISDQYWCSPPNKGYACGLTCAELEDDDISNDFICAQTIYKEHKTITGDGFNAWAVYKPHCKGPKADRYIKDCFNDFEQPKTVTTPASVIAHGFFDTAAGRANKGFSIPTQKPTYESFLNFRSPSIIQTNDFAFATKKPEVNLTPKSPFLANNRFFASTEAPNFDLFFTPTTSSTFEPSVSTSSVFTPTRPSTSSDVIIYNPTVSTPTNIASTTSRSIFDFGRTFSSPSSNLAFTPTVSTPTNIASTGSRSIFDFGRTFSSPSSNLIYTPTVSTPAYQSTTVSYPPPIFIINGVKWY